MFVRFVPLRDGSPVRSSFMNMWPEPGKPVKIKFGGLFKAASVAEIEVVDDRVVVIPARGVVAVNGEVITGPRSLVHGDVVALRDMKSQYVDPGPPVGARRYPKGEEVAYEFQEDLALAKRTHRRHDVPGAAPEGVPAGDAVAHIGPLTVDTNGISLPEERKIPARVRKWAEFDEIKFAPNLGNLDYGDDAVRAAAAGAQQGWKIGGFSSEDTLESLLEPKFHAPAYTLTFRRHGDGVDITEASRESCEEFADAIERFAPFDLVKFGDLQPHRPVLQEAGSSA